MLLNWGNTAGVATATAAVPEPGSVALFAACFAALAFAAVWGMDVRGVRRR